MENIIEGVLSAADGEIVGKIRTQKIFYLLEKMGMGSGYQFSYHHYGPYSEGLALQLDAECIFTKAIEEKCQTGDYGNVYSVFILNKEVPEPENLGELPYHVVKDKIHLMKSVTSVILELAATIYWLKNEEKVEDWRSELKLRKAQKATDGRIEKAVQLLGQLGMAG